MQDVTRIDGTAWLAWQASLHDHMKGTHEALLSELEAARCDTVDERPARVQRPVQRRAAAPSQGGLLGRIRAKAHAPAVRDVGSMLNRHKENRAAN
jgi:hypothetical protein